MTIDGFNNYQRQTTNEQKTTIIILTVDLSYWLTSKRESTELSPENWTFIWLEQLFVIVYLTDVCLYTFFYLYLCTYSNNKCMCNIVFFLLLLVFTNEKKIPTLFFFFFFFTVLIINDKYSLDMQKKKNERRKEKRNERMLE